MRSRPCSVSLGRMLTLFKPVYKSIDVRIACLREESGRWRNVLTVLRFSDQDSSALRASLRNLVTELGVIADEEFRIVLEARQIGVLGGRIKRPRTRDEFLFESGSLFHHRG